MGNRRNKKKKVDDANEPDFRAAGRSSIQNHRQPLYCVSWGSDHHVDENGRDLQYLASCGGRSLTIYEFDGKADGDLRLCQSYRDADARETFYACAFAGRSKYWSRKEPDDSESSSVDDESDQNTVSSLSNSSGSRASRRLGGALSSRKAKADTADKKEQFTLFLDAETSLNHLTCPRVLSSNTGPRLLCVGGESSVVKVVDLVQKKQIASMSGHGDDIYHMEVSPSNEFLLLTASVDKNIMLWNVDSFSCVAIFGAGQHGHHDSVICLSWHPSGDKFASSGMDRNIRLWNVNSGRLVEAVQASMNQGVEGNPRVFHPLQETQPYFATDRIHMNYIDGVKWLGNSILSKSTYNTIVHWVPKIPDESETSKVRRASSWAPPSEVVVLRIFELDQCNIWFIRFAIDPLGRWLAVGNINGEVELWNLASEKTKPSQRLSPIVNSTIRMLAFSPDGSTLVACNDGSSICKWTSAK